MNLSTDNIPGNLDAECAILGACIEDHGILDAVLAEGVDPGEFSVSDHRALWEAILQLCEKAAPVTLVSVAECLPRTAFPTLVDLTFGVVLVESHILHYVQIVKRKAKLRRLLHLCDWLSEEATAAGADPDSLAIQLNLKIGAIGLENLE